MKKYQILVDDLVTTAGAMTILGVSSRNSVKHYVKAGRIRYIWINEGETSAVRLLLKADVEAI